MFGIFGPANIPLFEAWYLKKPILYPSSFSKFSKNGAIFDEFNAKSLAQAIDLLDVKEIREEKISEGKRCINITEMKIKNLLIV